MSLTSYRAAPPRGSAVIVVCFFDGIGFVSRPLQRPGGDLLSHALRRSTIGAEGFHGRVRDGIGCLAPRHSHQVVEGGVILGLGEQTRRQRKAREASKQMTIFALSSVYLSSDIRC